MFERFTESAQEMNFQDNTSLSQFSGKTDAETFQRIREDVKDTGRGFSVRIPGTPQMLRIPPEYVIHWGKETSDQDKADAHLSDRNPLTEEEAELLIRTYKKKQIFSMLGVEPPDESSKIDSVLRFIQKAKLSSLDIQEIRVALDKIEPDVVWCMEQPSMTENLLGTYWQGENVPIRGYRDKTINLTEKKPLTEEEADLLIDRFKDRVFSRLGMEPPWDRDARMWWMLENGVLSRNELRKAFGQPLVPGKLGERAVTLRDATEEEIRAGAKQMRGRADGGTNGPGFFLRSDVASPLEVAEFVVKRMSRTEIEKSSTELVRVHQLHQKYNLLADWQKLPLDQIPTEEELLQLGYRFSSARASCREAHQVARETGIYPAPPENSMNPEYIKKVSEEVIHRSREEFRQQWVSKDEMRKMEADDPTVEVIQNVTIEMVYSNGTRVAVPHQKKQIEPMEYRVNGSPKDLLIGNYGPKAMAGLNEWVKDGEDVKRESPPEPIQSKISTPDEQEQKDLIELLRSKEAMIDATLRKIPLPPTGRLKYPGDPLKHAASTKQFCDQMEEVIRGTLVTVDGQHIPCTVKAHPHYGDVFTPEGIVPVSLDPTVFSIDGNPEVNRTAGAVVKEIQKGVTEDVSGAGKFVDGRLVEAAPPEEAPTLEQKIAALKAKMSKLPSGRYKTEQEAIEASKTEPSPETEKRIHFHEFL
jgi:hypothetical protein